jgi:phage-related protein
VFESSIYEGEYLYFQAISKQVLEWLEEATDRERANLAVAATILENSIRTGRPPAGRSERVEGSSTGLYELRVTPPGHRGVQVRILYVREGRTILCARAVSKRQRKISRREIELAERTIKDYRARR